MELRNISSMKDLSAVAKTSSALRCETPVKKGKHFFCKYWMLEKRRKEPCILLEKRSIRAIHWA